jgi:hypothetical protein
MCKFCVEDRNSVPDTDPLLLAFPLPLAEEGPPGAPALRLACSNLILSKKNQKFLGEAPVQVTQKGLAFHQQQVHLHLRTSDARLPGHLEPVITLRVLSQLLKAQKSMVVVQVWNQN